MSPEHVVSDPIPSIEDRGNWVLVRALIMVTLYLADGSEIARDRYRERSNSDTVFGIFSASPFSFSLSSSLAVYIEDFLLYKKISEQYCASRSIREKIYAKRLQLSSCREIYSII